MAFSIRLRTTLRNFSDSPITLPPETELSRIFDAVLDLALWASSITSSSRSTGSNFNLSRPASAFARIRRSSTRVCIRWASASPSRATLGQSASCGRKRETSSEVCRAEIGLLSSCDASATKRREDSADSSSLSSILFMVIAKRDISSSPSGSNTLRCRDVPVISLASEII